MDAYENYSQVYDLFNNQYQWCTDFIEKTIDEYSEHARSLLELACGTGIILEHFVQEYEVAGLDISASMLARAREKLPRVPLHEMDMTDFDLGRKFDLIICMYDSINHLLTYQDWAKTFRCVRRHLAPGGLFIFDMNTQERLDRMAQFPMFVQQVQDTYLILKVTKTPEGLTNWNIKIFQKTRGNLYALNEDNIPEASFPLDRVQSGLGELFEMVQHTTLENESNLFKGRVFFICRV